MRVAACENRGRDVVQPWRQNTRTLYLTCECVWGEQDRPAAESVRQSDSVHGCGLEQAVVRGGVRRVGSGTQDTGQAWAATPANAEPYPHAYATVASAQV